MNAKELMNRDLVRQKFSELQLRVHSITPPYILAYGEEGQFHEDSIEPIPITPEILLKNGFKKDERNEKMYTWNWGVIDNCISYDKETGIVRIFYVSGLAFKKILMYVHQLQQAMRLCGINKEIIVEDKQ